MGLRFLACAGLLSIGGLFLGCATGSPESTSEGGGGAGDPECGGRPDGTPCGDDSESACDGPDTCEGGICSPNVQAEGVVCGDATDTECNPADTCDGAGTCVERIEPIGAACGDPADTACTAPDTCDGAGTCLGNHKPSGFGCGDQSMTACSDPDACDGEGTCLTNDVVAGTPCGSMIDTQCTNPDSCDGLGVCAANDEPAGVACGNQASSECTSPDTCDGMGTCDPNHALIGVPCGSGMDTDCSDPDSCNGNGTCLANHALNGTSCNDCSAGAGECLTCELGICLDRCTSSLTTVFAQNNSQRGIMFDVRAKANITVERVQTSMSSGTHDVTMWYIVGGKAGHETTQGDWTLVGTAVDVLSNGTNMPTEIPLDIDVALTNGERLGIYIHTTDATDPGYVQYSNGTAEDAIFVQNTELEIREGRAIGTTPFTGTFSQPRVFNGIVSYELECD